MYYIFFFLPYKIKYLGLHVLAEIPCNQVGGIDDEFPSPIFFFYKKNSMYEVA